VKQIARVAILAVFIAVSIATALPPSTAMADSSPDYAVPLGHFYTQANGYAADTSNAGFAITDDDDVPFWIAYQQFGGPDVLGYPISRRYVWEGYTCQATQRAVMQWDPAAGTVHLVNLMDYMSEMGRDDWLNSAFHIPKPITNPLDALKTHEQISVERLSLLDSSPAIRDHYNSVPDPMATFGLPTSPVVDLKDFYVVRTQRTALFQCKSKRPWCVDGGVAALNAGDVARDAGLVPPDATIPEEPEHRYVASSRWEDRDITGDATWYGWGFHGRVMRNGELFNMYDSTIAACNIYPLGTLLRVTNLDTGGSIIVRVTDTGGFTWPIVIDLSWGAFNALGDPAAGRLSVSLQPVERGY
jgi:hypothetical protein